MMASATQRGEQSPDATSGISVGVPVYRRTEALAQLLRSVPEYVDEVIVGDNGEAAERAELYARSFPFEVTVLDLEYDCGIGACRAAIADAVATEYLFVGDNDMRFVREGDLRTLVRVLEADDSLGGVAGWLWEGDRIRTGATYLHTYDLPTETVLYKSVPEAPEIRAADGIPYAVFDYIPQAAVMRREAVQEPGYDPELRVSEHGDFFLNHLRNSEWQFASTPAVLIHHDQHIDRDYRDERDATDTNDMVALSRKWGVERLTIGARPDWMTTRDRSTGEHAFDVFRAAAPPWLWIPIRDRLHRAVNGGGPW